MYNCMDSKNHGCLFWDRLARSYDEHAFAMYGKAYARSIEKIRQGLSPTDRVVELGCGTGILSLGAASAAAQILGIDSSAGMIERAEEKRLSLGQDNVRFLVADAVETGLPDKSFDAVIAFNVLQGVVSPAAFLAEAARILTPEGLVFLAVDCFAEPMGFCSKLRLIAPRLLHVFGILPFLWSFSKEGLDELLSSAGFVVDEREVLHPDPMNCFLRASVRR